MRARVLALVGILFLLVARPAASQRLTGVIRDSTTGEPVAGAVVSVVGPNGGPANRTIASADGRFSLPVPPTGGGVEIRSIGFLPRNLPLPEAARAGDASIAVVLQRIAYSLDAVLVSSSLDPVPVSAMACRTPDPSAGEALALWEQARTAFLATIVGRDAVPAQMRVLNFKIEKSRFPATAAGVSTTGVRPLMARSTENVVTLGEVSDSLRVSTTPWVQWRSPQDMETRGYVESGAVLVMYAPNAEVLLDQTFVRTHCFSMAPADTLHAGQIGVAFRPVEARSSMSEVEGVLWMDRSPLALRRLDYTYVGPGTFSIRQSGGWVRFRLAPNGIVLVDEWAIYYPGSWGSGWVTTSANTVPPAKPLESLRLVIGGSTLLSADWPDGAKIAPSGATLRGRVVEAEGGGPVAGAKVSLAVGTPPSVTRNDGMFSLMAPIPERYPVQAVDSSLATFGVVRTQTALGESAEGVAGPVVSIALEPRLLIARAQCQKRSLGGGLGALLIRVVDQAGVLSDAPVALKWKGPQGKSVEKKWDAKGGWLTVCDVGDAPLNLAAVTARLEGYAVARPSGAAVVDTVTIVMHRPGGL